MCDANGVKGYPQLTLFRDGEIVEHYKGRRDHDLLTAYIDDQAAPSAPAPEHKPEAANTPLNVDGNVLVLGDDTFGATIEQGHAFVKFYAPWSVPMSIFCRPHYNSSYRCGHCKKLAPTWKQLARHMQNKLTIAEVDCEDHSALCKSQGITGYPTLVYYGGAGVKSDYAGGRKIDQLKAFADKASAE